MSDDPLRGFDFSERVKPLMQEMVLLDQKRMEEVAALRQQLAGAVEERDELAALIQRVLDSPLPISGAWSSEARAALSRFGGQ